MRGCRSGQTDWTQENPFLIRKVFQPQRTWRFEDIQWLSAYAGSNPVPRTFA